MIDLSSRKKGERDVLLAILITDNNNNNIYAVANPTFMIIHTSCTHERSTCAAATCWCWGIQERSIAVYQKIRRLPSIATIIPNISFLGFFYIIYVIILLQENNFQIVVSVGFLNIVLDPL